MTTLFSTRRRRSVPLAIGLLALCAATACNDFLSAENPGAVEEPSVNNPAYAGLIANGPIYGFQLAYTDMSYWNAQFTDELYNRATFVEEGQIDRRELFSDMTYINAFIYAPMQRARFLGEDASRRLKTILGDTASRDLRIARALAYEGYSYIALGETMCTTPINVGKLKTTPEMMADAIIRFQEAISTAQAARTFLAAQVPVNANAVAAADSVLNFARVGAARAALNRNDKPQAIAFASLVPADFVFRAFYSDNTTGQRNRVFERLTLSSNAFLQNTPFLAMAGDPRVPRITTPASRANTPLSPPSFSTFNNTPAGADFAPIMSMRIASGLEAQYIVAEAQGPTANTLAFVNLRRAAGLQGAVTLAGDELMAELRDQRSRDFYLDGHRLGDLRRYKQYYNIDLFPKGPYPGTTSGQVYNESVTCWPLPTNELNGNPNINN